MSKFAIGIDLGTTNCVVAYTQLDVEQAEIQTLPIRQISAANQLESFDSLPSFLYVPSQAEGQSGAFSIPDFPEYPTIQGVYARQNSAEQPERTIAAAKSWLCHGGVDRHSPILPWDSDAETVTKFSPVAATRFLLRQLVDNWEQEHPEAPIAEQLVTLTVPASFDMSARELTREAALQAGLPEDFILLEEPQAAVYHWLEKSGDEWRKSLTEGDTLLVCDVGGGTTDFTLVQVDGESGELALSRKAVGNHLLVGGDNMDLALAHLAAQKFAEKGTQLDPWQSVALWHSCRRAKESLLSESGRDVETVSVLGRGSKLIGGTVSVELNRDEVQAFLVDGFLPLCSPDDRPEAQSSSGFQELGLPFESDSGISRHLAKFLAENNTSEGTSDHNASGEGNQAASGGVHLLLNGGVFRSEALRERLIGCVEKLTQNAPEILSAPDDLDHAVARGAAFYGWAKQNGGVRIRGGAARSYYVGIETAGLAIPGMPRPLSALCVVPHGMEEGTEADVPGKEVGLAVGREAKFRFFASGQRKDDKVGDVLKQWSEDELLETSPMDVTLDAEEADGQNFVPVRFHSRISELGVFELWCKSTRDAQQWKLEFSIRESEDEQASQAAASE